HLLRLFAQTLEGPRLILGLGGRDAGIPRRGGVHPAAVLGRVSILQFRYSAPCIQSPDNLHPIFEATYRLTLHPTVRSLIWICRTSARPILSCKPSAAAVVVGLLTLATGASLCNSI